MNTEIDARAWVDAGARLGARVRVGPGAIVAAGAVIGDDCEIGPHAVVYGGVTLGARVRVHAHAVLGDTPQDLGFDGAASRVDIGPGCVVREGATIHRGTGADTVTRVGANCYLMVNVHLAHNVRLGDRVIIANGALLAGHVAVGDGVFISGNALVHQFVRIGRLAMLGGGAAVSKDVPPGCICRANSLNEVTGLNVVGLRRAGWDAAARRGLKDAFNRLYRSGLNIRQAAAELRQFPEGHPARELGDFVATARRGICALAAGAAAAAADADA